MKHHLPESSTHRNHIGKLPSLNTISSGAFILQRARNARSCSATLFVLMRGSHVLQVREKCLSHVTTKPLVTNDFWVTYTNNANSLLEVSCLECTACLQARSMHSKCAAYTSLSSHVRAYWEMCLYGRAQKSAEYGGYASSSKP